jgi:hypothetical protein
MNVASCFAPKGYLLISTVVAAFFKFLAFSEPSFVSRAEPYPTVD